eukprot:366338-Chlamydomonas_euryale.AAC.14
MGQLPTPAVWHGRLRAAGSGGRRVRVEDTQAAGGAARKLHLTAYAPHALTRRDAGASAAVGVGNKAHRCRRLSSGAAAIASCLRARCWGRAALRAGHISLRLCRSFQQRCGSGGIDAPTAGSGASVCGALVASNQQRTCHRIGRKPRQRTEAVRNGAAFNLTDLPLHGAAVPLRHTAARAYRIPAAPWSARQRQRQLRQRCNPNAALKRGAEHSVGAARRRPVGQRLDALKAAKQRRLYDERGEAATPAELRGRRRAWRCALWACVWE